MFLHVSSGILKPQLTMLAVNRRIVQELRDVDDWAPSLYEYTVEGGKVKTRTYEPGRDVGATQENELGTAYKARGHVDGIIRSKHADAKKPSMMLRSSS